MELLLKRDWFVDEEAILELFDQMDAETYNKFYDNRYKYSRRIRECLAPEEADASKPPNSKMRVVEMTTQEMLQNKHRLYLESIADMERKWEEHKKKTGICRPMNSLDTEHDDCFARMKRAKSPSKIEALKNEYNVCSKFVEQADNEWNTKARYEWAMSQM
jgi:hypothetical protein